MVNKKKPRKMKLRQTEYLFVAGFLLALGTTMLTQAAIEFYKLTTSTEVLLIWLPALMVIGMIFIYFGLSFVKGYEISKRKK